MGSSSARHILLMPAVLDVFLRLCPTPLALTLAQVGNPFKMIIARHIAQHMNLESGLALFTPDPAAFRRLMKDHGAIICGSLIYNLLAKRPSATSTLELIVSRPFASRFIENLQTIGATLALTQRLKQTLTDLKSSAHGSSNGASSHKHKEISRGASASTSNANGTLTPASYDELRDMGSYNLSISASNPMRWYNAVLSR
ncbi:hypothetical protein CALCODRAFT_506081 [Calocera cornea HHB12733]|uniref:Uncharacterized protein n=1 Tax=Calocera cornea HHB12733 TaxID=1353952 RepID=A0A165JF18_9BASI|nr:hypothetical protein CALCODRAFT_506081 [Calocera cornea HHB12733]